MSNSFSKFNIIMNKYKSLSSCTIETNFANTNTRYVLCFTFGRIL